MVKDLYALFFLSRGMKKTIEDLLEEISWNMELKYIKLTMKMDRLKNIIERMEITLKS